MVEGNHYQIMLYPGIPKQAVEEVKFPIVIS